jgi:protein-S-isoprenylcysteine O-methyltransferase Ste14
VRPLIFRHALAAAIFWPGVAAWAFGEAALAWRTRATRHVDSDRRTAGLMTLSFTLAMASAFWLASLRVAPLPGGGWPWLLIGVVLTWSGLVLRVWAVRTLGRFFQRTVMVHDEHPVIDTGPYRRLRHPSYTGMLLVTVGVGLSLGNWLSVAACIVFPLVGLLTRIGVEEAVLERELGEPYRRYESRTHRLVPGIW